MTAWDWYAWAAQTSLEATLIPAQDDELIRKPEVIDLERKGGFYEAVQFTVEELNEALASIGYVVHKTTEAYIPRERSAEYVDVTAFLEKVAEELEEEHVHEWGSCYSGNDAWLECNDCGKTKDMP